MGSQRLRELLENLGAWIRDRGVDLVDEYPGWVEIYRGAERTLKDEELDVENRNLILTALALDANASYLLDVLIDHSAEAARLVPDWVKHPDLKARWQAAVFLSRQDPGFATPFLRLLCLDKDEYVRYVAGRALAGLEDQKSEAPDK